MVPIGEALPGMEINQLPKDYVPMECVVLVKCLDEEGGTAWIQRWTEGLHLVEVTGATTVMQALNKRDAVNMYMPEEDEDDETGDSNAG